MISAGLEIHVEFIDDLLRLARQCNMQSLIEKVEDTTAKAEFFRKQKNIIVLNF